MSIPDYYSILGVSPTASAEEIKKAYQRESLKCHPDRFPNATREETQAHTQRFQSVADAYYILSDKSRRAEYDALRPTSTPQPGRDDANTQSDSARFFRSHQRHQPEAEHMFADVWAELLRPEVDRHVPIWKTAGTVSGAMLGYIVGNIPGALGGAMLGNRLGAVRDAKGRAVSEVFLSLPGRERAEILRTLAVKILGSL